MTEHIDAEQPLLNGFSDTERCVILTEEAPQEETSWRAELNRVLHLALPIAATGVLAYTSRLITTAQVGHLSSLSLSRLALGQTVYNITGLSLVMGMSSGITTCVGQAHGAAEAALKGVILQRGVLIALLTALFPLLGWTQVTRLLGLLGQQSDIADGAAAYIHWACPALMLSAINTCVENYLSAQQVVRPLVLVTLISTSLTPLLNNIFIRTCDWGFMGAALTLVVVQLIDSTLKIVIAIWHNKRQPSNLRPWSGFTTGAFTSWRSYLTVAVPACAMICLDWWAFEALTLLAGVIPDAEWAVAAIGVCFGIHVVIFLLIDGISIAVSVRVANELGAGRSAAARGAVVVGGVLGLAVTLVIITPMAVFPHLVAAIFTNDEQVINIVVACLPGLLLSLVGDAINNVLSGCIRGAGKQALGSLVNFGTFWCFGLPLAAVISLHLGWGAPGLWWAMAVTSVVQAIVLAGVVGSLDWQKEAGRAKRLVRSMSTHD